MRFKSLSKRWYSVISGAHFSRLHQKKYRTTDRSQRSLLIDTRGSIHILDWELFDINKKSLRLFEGPIKTGFDPKSVQFVGSCQGLICSYHGMDYYFVWNPSTKNSRKISGYSSIRQNFTIGVNDIAIIIRGFGYVSSIDDYKIVEIQFVTSMGTSNFKISVFKLKGDNWEDITGDDHSLNLWHRCYLRPGTALVDETVHWLVDITESYTSVIAFDLVEEKIQLQHHCIQLPSSLSAKYDAFLSVVEHRLCLCNKNQSFIEMWILRDLKWEKHFKIDLGTNFVGGTKFSEWNLFGSSSTDTLKIMVRPCDGRTHLVVDLNQCQLKQMLLPHHMYLSFAVSYVESLVCP
ncbi:hypothetical protein RND81_05G097300 [Saponaria officinalis]|uniref:F-box associated beta-propeller type 1 domain-containing protein n=1 Tax=Saponaria officinalis TaxID=3572 RepID=A0AAW1KUZ1_SAPOF